MNRDEVYREPAPQLVDFAFDDKVADVFPDMIRRSVPGYETVIPLTGLLAARHLAEHAGGSDRIYDLGCSLGASSLAVLRQLGERPATITAVDSSAAMIGRARTLVTDPRVHFRVADIRTLAFEPAAVVLLNYVLQFVPPEDRLALLRALRAALAPQGMLILSEKLRADDPDEQALFEAAHLDYKRANGYSELEISQKRTALENVMIIDSDATHRQRLAAAGFSRVRRWYQCLNWGSYLVQP